MVMNEVGCGDDNDTIHHHHTNNNSEVQNIEFSKPYMDLMKTI